MESVETVGNIEIVMSINFNMRCFEIVKRTGERNPKRINFNRSCIK